MQLVQRKDYLQPTKRCYFSLSLSLSLSRLWIVAPGIPAELVCPIMSLIRSVSWIRPLDPRLHPRRGSAARGRLFLI